jgi:hypothetical protein
VRVGEREGACAGASTCAWNLESSSLCRGAPPQQNHEADESVPEAFLLQVPPLARASAESRSFYCLFFYFFGSLFFSFFLFLPFFSPLFFSLYLFFSSSSLPTATLALSLSPLFSVVLFFEGSSARLSLSLRRSLPSLLGRNITPELAAASRATRREAVADLNGVGAVLGGLWEGGGRAARGTPKNGRLSQFLISRASRTVAIVRKEKATGEGRKEAEDRKKIGAKGREKNPRRRTKGGRGRESGMKKKRGEIWFEGVPFRLSSRG